MLGVPIEVEILSVPGEVRILGELAKVENTL